MVYRDNVLIVATGLGGVKILTVEFPEPTPEPTTPPDNNCDTLYGVHAKNSEDSQIVRFAPGSSNIEALGQLHKDHDLEGLDTDPITGKIYTIAGGKGKQKGNLFEVNPDTGQLRLIGNTGATQSSREIESLAFHPTSGELWAYKEKSGLYTLDLNSGAASLKWNAPSNSKSWEGLAWSPDGEALYGVSNSKLYRWDPESESASQVCGNLPQSTEALDFRPDGVMIATRSYRGKLGYFTIEPDSCEIDLVNISTSFNDIEGLSCGPNTTPQPEPTPVPTAEPTPQPSVSPPNACFTGKLNFAGLRHGEVLSEQYAEQGIHLSGISRQLSHNTLLWCLTQTATTPGTLI